MTTLLVRLRESSSPTQNHTVTEGWIWDLILAPQAWIFLESSLCVWLRAKRAPDCPTYPFLSLLASCGLALTRGLCMPFLTPSVPTRWSSLSPGGPSQAWGTCRPKSTAGILNVSSAATRGTRQAGFSREAQGLVLQPEARFQAHKLPTLTSLAWPLTSHPLRGVLGKHRGLRLLP